MMSTDQSIADQYTDDDLLQSIDPTGYRSSVEQSYVHQIFMQYMSPDASVIEFGACRGDFFASWQQAKQTHPRYLGVEQESKFVETASKKYPGISMLVSDYMNIKDLKYDWAITDSLNTKYSTDKAFDKYDNLYKVLDKMLEVSTLGVVTILHSHLTTQTDVKTSDKYLYYESQKVYTDLIEKFGSKKLILLDHSLTVDGFVLMIRHQ